MKVVKIRKKWGFTLIKTLLFVCLYRNENSTIRSFFLTVRLIRYILYQAEKNLVKSDSPYKEKFFNTRCCTTGVSCLSSPTSITLFKQSWLLSCTKAQKIDFFRLCICTGKIKLETKSFPNERQTKTCFWISIEIVACISNICAASSITKVS